MPVRVASPPRGARRRRRSVALAAAKIVNVELKFTPYTGAPQRRPGATRAGTAAIFVNGIPTASNRSEQEDGARDGG